MLMKIKKKNYLRERWKRLDILIIDEISMLNPDLFDKLEEIARNIRRDERPFGGIQLIISGDFCQLPPIDKEKEVKYCFESQKWKECIDETVVFNHDEINEYLTSRNTRSSGYIKRLYYQGNKSL